MRDKWQSSFFGKVKGEREKKTHFIVRLPKYMTCVRSTKMPNVGKRHRLAGSLCSWRSEILGKIRANEKLYKFKNIMRWYGNKMKKKNN